jgi:ribosomal protein S14
MKKNASSNRTRRQNTSDHDERNTPIRRNVRCRICARRSSINMFLNVAREFLRSDEHGDETRRVLLGSHGFGAIGWIKTLLECGLPDTIDLSL